MQDVTIEPFNIVGISVRTTNENGQAAQDIGVLWNRFFSENLLDKIPDKVDDTIYSLYTEYEGDHTQPYTAVLGCKVGPLRQIPKGMVGMAFDGGRYTRLTARGDLTKGLIVEQWMKIWEMDLERRFTVDFEVFGTAAQNPVGAEVDFFVAVK